MAAPSEATIEQLAALYEMEPAESESRLRFVQELKQSHTAQGSSDVLNRIPIVKGRVLDLAKLFDLVSNIGGSAQIAGRQWAELSLSIGLQAENAQIVEDHFQHILSPLEKYRAFAGNTTRGTTGVQNQLNAAADATNIPEAQLSTSTSSTATIDAQRVERQRQMREQMAREEQQRRRVEQLRQEQQEYERKSAMKATPAPPVQRQQPPPSEPPSTVPQQEPQMVLKIARPIIAPTAKRPRTSAGSSVGGFSNPTANTSMTESSQQTKIARHSRNTDDLKPLIANLYSTDLHVAIHAINEVLVKSSDTDQPLLLEEIPELLPALCYLLDVHDPLGPILFNNSASYENIVLSRAYDISRAIDDNSILLNLLTILSNLSFEIANENFLSFSVTIMRHLVTLIHISTPNGPSSPLTDASRLAFGVLSQIAKNIDAPCRRRVQCDLWMEDPIDGKPQNTLGIVATPLCSMRTKFSQHGAMLKKSERRRFSSPSELETTLSNPLMIEIIRSIYPLLLYKMSSFNKEVVLCAIDLLGKLATNSENVEMFENAPDLLFSKISEFLGVTTLGVEPFELANRRKAALSTNYGSATMNDVVGHLSGVEDMNVPSCIGSFLEFSDAEVRDAALDAIYSMAQMSQRNLQRFVSTRSFLKRIPKLLEIQVLPEKTRLVDREITLHQKIIAILTLMLSDPTLRNHLRTIHVDMNILASSDDIAADFMNSISALVVYHDDYNPAERAITSLPLAPGGSGAVISNESASSGMVLTLPRLVLKL